MNEAIDLSSEIGELEEGEGAYTFDGITRLTIKTLRYHDVGGSS